MALYLHTLSHGVHAHPLSSGRSRQLLIRCSTRISSMNSRYTSLHDLAPPSSSSTAVHPRGRSSHHPSGHGERTPRSRSPSPIARKPDRPSARHGHSRPLASSDILSALSKNGYDHVRLELSGGAMHSVLESDVHAFFSDKVENVLRDHGAW